MCRLGETGAGGDECSGQQLSWKLAAAEEEEEEEAACFHFYPRFCHWDGQRRGCISLVRTHTHLKEHHELKACF